MERKSKRGRGHVEPLQEVAAYASVAEAMRVCLGLSCEAYGIWRAQCITQTSGAEGAWRGNQVPEQVVVGCPSELRSSHKYRLIQRS